MYAINPAQNAAMEKAASDRDVAMRTLLERRLIDARAEATRALVTAESTYSDSDWNIAHIAADYEHRCEVAVNSYCYGA